jgi:LysR family glycine cleavage system transcriptional activator
LKVNGRLPSLNPLRAFEATARSLSASQAALELNVTPGAISHQLRVLEKELNAKFFYRAGRRLRLTAQGAALYTTVSSAFDTISDAVALLDRSKNYGELLVACPQAVASFWLIPHLSEFAHAHPRIEVNLGVIGSGSTATPHEPDLTIRYGDGNWRNRSVELWSALSLFPVCSPALVNGCPLRNIEDLSQHVLLHADDGKEWCSWLKAVERPSLRVRSHRRMASAHLAIEAAVCGQGIALGDNVTTTFFLNDGRLVTPLVHRKPSPDAFYIVCANEARETPIVNAFINWLKQKVNEPPEASRRAQAKSKRLSR